MLAIFYLTIPVGRCRHAPLHRSDSFSALGFIVGSQVASLLGSWRWALRVSPPFGVVLVILAFIFLKDPPRGHADGTSHSAATIAKH